MSVLTFFRTFFILLIPSSTTLITCYQNENLTKTDKIYAKFGGVKIKYIITFVLGSFILIFNSFLQKIVIHADVFDPVGYIVPFFYGGFTALIVLRLYMNKKKLLNEKITAEHNSCLELEKKLKNVLMN